MSTPTALLPLALVFAACSSSGAPTQSPEPAEPLEVTDIVGTWAIDLRQAPSDEAASTVLVIESVDDGVLAGSFYQSPVSQGRIKAIGGEVCFSFVTEDGSGPYLTAGRLGPDGGLKGMTNSTGRDFLNVWTGVRE
ncbi:MAG: hypothetical protein K0V04_30080 [Deltaproteobacteria bacterium]|nr:hypothetical protein [Deltaproteobacteria bacterium]